VGTPEPVPPPVMRGRPISRAVSGPLDTPARTAAVIAVLGVMVMTVSVGAIVAALRVR